MGTYEVKKKMSPTQKILIGNYYYKYSDDELFMSDGEYTAELEKLSKFNPLRYLRWEQIDTFSEEIEEILKKFNIKDIKTTTNELKKADVEDDFKFNLRNKFPSPKSMQMIGELDKLVTAYLPQILDIAIELGESVIELLMSYKEDGWKIKNYYVKGEEKKTVYSHTRGRYSDNIKDCTELLRYLTPEVPISNDFIYSIEGELMITKPGLEQLRISNPNKKWNNVRNSITSFTSGTIDIKTNHDKSIYQAYYVDCYNTETKEVTPVFNKTSDMYIWLKSIGFNIPHYKLIQVDISGLSYEEAYMKLVEEVYTSFEEFEEHYETIYSKTFECDGIVLQPNVIGWSSHMQQIAQGNFGDGLLAIKAGIWANKKHTSEVIDILYSKASKRKNLMLKVKPVRSNLGQNMSNVDVGRLYLGGTAYHDIRIGDIVEFTTHSQQNVKFTRNISNEERKMKSKI